MVNGIKGEFKNRKRKNIYDIDYLYVDNMCLLHDSSFWGSVASIETFSERTSTQCKFLNSADTNSRKKILKSKDNCHNLKRR